MADDSEDQEHKLIKVLRKIVGCSILLGCVALIYYFCGFAMTLMVIVTFVFLCAFYLTGIIP